MDSWMHLPSCLGISVEVSVEASAVGRNGQAGQAGHARRGGAMTVLLLILLWFAPGLAAIDPTVDPFLDAQLRTAATELDRTSLLPTDSDWVFDYFGQEGYAKAPGSVVNANAATFPAAVGNGMTMAWISLGPCAMLPPHWHARASNYVVAIEGDVDTWMVAENGARLVRARLTAGKMTVLPKGSLHAMANTGCANATLISALSSDDAGTLNVVNGLLGLPDDIVQAAFGNNPVFAKLADILKDVPGVGTGASEGSASCLARCAASESKA